VFEMQDEVRAHYVALEAGSNPELLLEFNAMDAPELFFPQLMHKEPEAFTLYLKGFEAWIYDLFKQ
jgi:hypothetical protein